MRCPCIRAVSMNNAFYLECVEEILVKYLLCPPSGVSSKVLCERDKDPHQTFSLLLPRCSLDDIICMFR